MKLTRNNPQGRLAISRSNRSNSTLSDPLHLPISKPLDPVKSGYLNKRGQVNPDWKKRFFMLDQQHLYYFKTDKDDKFTGVIQLLFCSIRKLGLDDPDNSDASPNCWKIITPTRVFFLQAPNPQAAEDWMQAISGVCCILWEQENVISKNPDSAKNDIIKQGFLLKRGNNIVKDWKQRWFVLKDQYVAYYNTKTDYTPLGTIRLLQCSVKVSQTMTKKHCLEFVTPSRTFYACAANEKEMREWMEAIKAAISSTLEAFFEKNSTPKTPANSLNNSANSSKTNSSTSFNTSNNSSSTPNSPATNRSNTIVSTLRKNYSTTDIPSNSPQNRSTVDVEVMQTYQNRQNNNNSNSNNTTSGSSTAQNTEKPPTNKNEPKSLSKSQEVKTAPADPELPPPQDNNTLSESQEDPEECQLPDKTLAGLMEEILTIPENKVCAECDSPDPKWASINIGIFICIECSGIHRSLGVHVSKVRSVQLDDWDTDTLDFMHSMGNKKAREIWEFKVLPGYTRPQPDSPRNIKTIWIQAKYQDRLFADPDIIKPLESANDKATGAKQVISEAPYKEGFLNKLPSKEDLIKAWKKRWFILKNNNLYYYIQREDAIPTGMIRLAGAIVRVAATNQSREHSFEIVTPSRVYVIAADDSPDMASWMNYLKLSIQFFEEKTKTLKRLPSLDEDDNRDSFIYDEQTTIRRHTLVLKAQSIKKKGYLYKKGNNLIKDWRRRWFVLYKHSVYYYDSEEHQNDQLPLGILELESVEITISKEVPKKFYFELCTPNRIYYLYAESREEMQDWIKALKECMKDAKARASEIQMKRKSTIGHYQAIPSFLQEPQSSSSSSPGGRSGTVTSKSSAPPPSSTRASTIREPANTPSQSPQTQPQQTQAKQNSPSPQNQQPPQQNSQSSSSTSSNTSPSNNPPPSQSSHYQRIPTFS